MLRGLFILSITIGISFASGQLVAKKASKSFQDQVQELMASLKEAEKAHAINKRQKSSDEMLFSASKATTSSQPKNTKSQDPNL